MADFCKQCSFDMWGEDYGDMKGLSTEEHSKSGLFSLVLCEDCGPCQVDHEGSCVSEDCFKCHGKQET